MPTVAELLTLNHTIATCILLLQVGLVAFVAVYWYKPSFVGPQVARYALPTGFLLTLGALVMSLVYSEYFGIVPCGLCWFSRIVMYPQVVLFGIAWWKKDSNIAIYSIALSLIGLVISLYHHALQMGVHSNIPCPASGAGDCAKRTIFEYGYITFPLIGATIFATLLVLMFIYLREQRNVS